MKKFRRRKLYIFTSRFIDWEDLFLLHLITFSFQWEERLKIAEDYNNPEYFQGTFPNTRDSFIKPLAKHPSFGSNKWHYPMRYIHEQTPRYVIQDDFHLVYGGNLYPRGYLQLIDAGYTHYQITPLPKLQLENYYILARHPLAFAASFDPLLPLDLWSWILSLANFSGLTLVILISHMALRPTQFSVMNNLYHATDYWKDVPWFKTASLLLFLWAFTFYMFSIFYQIDFRTGLISQTLERPVESWNDIDLFNVNFITLSFPKLSVGTNYGFYPHKNLLEYDRYRYRYMHTVDSTLFSPA